MGNGSGNDDRGAGPPDTSGGGMTIPAGMETSFLLIDRKTGVPTVSADEHQRYRSASLVKLFIALDYLESRGPEVDIPDEDRALLVPMLRSSDDGAASALWVRGEEQEIVRRMIGRIGLNDTAPPEDANMWGYTAISAADIARTYQYILDGTHPRFRDFLLDHLRRWTKCGSDGFDQSFGVPSGMSEPGAVKQGWSGFETGAPRRVRWSASRERPPSTRTLVPGKEVRCAPTLDLTRRAMHTSGTAGANDEKIIVVLTLEPEDMSWEECASRITGVTRALDQAADDR
jgi:hypothetical protein